MSERPKWLLACQVVLLVCGVAFAGVFGALLLAPAAVERAVRPAVVEYVKAEALERYPALNNLSVFSGLAESLRASGRVKRGLITPEYPEAVGRIFSRLCKYECGDEQSLAEVVRGGLTRALESLGVGLARVEAWATGRYGELMGEIVRDLRVVTGCNAALLLLAALALRQGGVRRWSLALAGCVFMATLNATYLAVFRQSWLVAWVLGSNAAAAYLVWVCVIGALLADIALNKGRLTAALGHSVARIASV
ncbi:MAG: hypothetical protein QM756_42450 [Polyangiaceae bacterium]